jgi:ABC-2 type transport system ATP-binding protein
VRDSCHATDEARRCSSDALALDQLSFTVTRGHVTGFVGPNGAGKSTTMRVILALDKADAGRALIGGQPYRRQQGGRVRAETGHRRRIRSRG